MENWFWLIIMVIALVFEAATVNLVSLWFALGALAAQAVVWLGGAFSVQLVVFVIVSVLALIFLYPKLRRVSRGRGVATNIDRIIGTDAIVLEDIDSLRGTGSVKVDGKVWSAKPENSDCIPANSIVTIVKIEGAHTVVRLKSE